MAKTKIDLWIEEPLLEELEKTISLEVEGDERIHVRSQIINGAIEGFLKRLHREEVSMKYPEVKVMNSADGYTVKVAVFRHVTSPKEITVHIESIHPLPPRQPEEFTSSVCKLVKPGEGHSFKVESTYPEKS